MIREFTRDDWYAWQGAEAFRDGEPLLFESDRFHNIELFAIADATGIEFHVDCAEPIDEPEIMAWKLKRTTNKRKAQRALLESLLEELDIEHSGCAADVTYCLDHMDGMEAM